jgi:hypothetical protein
MEKGMLITTSQDFSYNRIISAFKMVEFVSNGMSYITLKGCRWDNVLHVHAPTEDKDGDIKV